MKARIYASCVNPYSPRGNLGDKFGYYLADHILQNNNATRLGVNDKDKINSETIAITGSILESIYNKNIISYGNGFIRQLPKPLYTVRADIQGVRGELSSKYIQNKHKRPKVVSDPGLLLSDLFSLQQNINQKELGFIIHSVDRKHFFENHPAWKPLLIDNYKSPENFVLELSKYKRVVSSSLHGVIFCHSYGIPVAPIIITGRVIGNGFKFYDYYSSITDCYESIDLVKYNQALTHNDYINYVNLFHNPAADLIEEIKYRQTTDIRYILGV